MYRDIDRADRTGNPSLGESSHARGSGPQDKKDNKRAIADYDAAIKIEPHYAAAFYNRGNARLDLGDRNGAIADYRQALKLDPHLRQAADMLKEVEPQKQRSRRR